MSEEFYGKSIPITSGFDLGAKSPLDTRSIVNTIEERNAHVTGNRVYEGMKVYVLAEKKEYRYNGNDWEEVRGTTEVSQGETEPTEENVLLWIDTTSDENMVENNLSNSLITEFQDSISTLNTRVSTLEKNIEPPFGEDAHIHSNKVVLDKITQAHFDKWNNKSDFNGSYNSLTDKPTIPTRTSELINDSNYVTSSNIPTSLPANGGNADTVSGYTIWVGTQTEYDAISSKNSTTIYFIRG